MLTRKEVSGWPGLEYKLIWMKMNESIWVGFDSIVIWLPDLARKIYSFSKLFKSKSLLLGAHFLYFIASSQWQTLVYNPVIEKPFRFFSFARLVPKVFYDGAFFLIKWWTSGYFWQPQRYGKNLGFKNTKFE